MVVKVHSESEVRRILPIAKRLGVPITFRAAGTSLSGQASDDRTTRTPDRLAV
jgi:D-lactate dehydrogenase